MSHEIVTIIAEIMIYIGLLFAMPFLYRCGRSFGAFLFIKWDTRHQLIFIDSNGNEIQFSSKEKIDKNKIIDLLQGRHDKAK